MPEPLVTWTDPQGANSVDCTLASQVLEARNGQYRLKERETKYVCQHTGGKTARRPPCSGRSFVRAGSVLTIACFFSWVSARTCVTDPRREIHSLGSRLQGREKTGIQSWLSSQSYILFIRLSFLYWTLAEPSYWSPPAFLQASFGDEMHGAETEDAASQWVFSIDSNPKTARENGSTLGHVWKSCHKSNSLNICGCF